MNGENSTINRLVAYRISHGYFTRDWFGVRLYLVPDDYFKIIDRFLSYVGRYEKPCISCLADIEDIKDVINLNTYTRLVQIIRGLIPDCATVVSIHFTDNILFYK